MSQPTMLQGSEFWWVAAVGFGSRGLNSSQALHFTRLAMASTVSLACRQPSIFTSTWFGGCPQLWWSFSSFRSNDSRSFAVSFPISSWSRASCSLCWRAVG